VGLLSLASTKSFPTAPICDLGKEWETFRDAPFEYRKGEPWDWLLHQGAHLLEKFIREERVVVQRPQENLQLKLTRTLAGGNVAFVVFVRKQLPEIQYLKATISEEQRKEFGRLVETTVHHLESGYFSSHSGIRFPNNGCTSCAHLGLCLNNSQLIETKLIRKPAASDLDWLDELVD
jgi:hypothetical protein